MRAVPGGWTPAGGLRAGLRRVLLWLLLGAVAGCAGSVEGLPVREGPVAPDCCAADPGAGTSDEAVLEYLGVGGWRIEWAGRSILTAPFFSNPSMVRTGLWTIGADTVRIHRLLTPADDDAVLVGHAHYDHLMDVPHIAAHEAPRARVVGSRTAAHLLAAGPGFAPGRMIRADTMAGSHASPGRWIELAGGRIRVMPLLSDHAPHALGIEVLEGRLTRDLRWLPGAAAGWPVGTTYAYLIDLLDDAGRVALRIHYQDAASEPPAGLIPPLPPGDRRRVDVAILCPPGFDEVDGYPDRLLREARPRHALLGHWEDFFRTRDEELRVVPSTDLRAFLGRLREALPDDAGWTLPAPGARITFRARPGG